MVGNNRLNSDKNTKQSIKTTPDDQDFIAYSKDL